MAAVVASVPPSSCSPSSSDGGDVVSPVMVLTAEQQARKRRREYLSSQRGSLESLLDEALGTLIPTTTSTHVDVPGPSLLLLPATEEVEDDKVCSPGANKKCKVSEDEASATSYLTDDNESLSFGNARKGDATTSAPVLSLGTAATATSHSKSSKNKKTKPQRKYDPDVPMTKEEAASWRREQRRKRNRESAAASRQRQRDRIDELETELASWKSMHDDVLDKIKKLEQGTGVAVGVDTTDVVVRHESPATFTSTTAPTGASTVTPRASPTASPSSVVTSNDRLGQDKIDRSVPVVPMVPQNAHEDDEEDETEQGWEGLLPLKMISRPAVS